MPTDTPRETPAMFEITAGIAVLALVGVLLDLVRRRS